MSSLQTLWFTILMINLSNAEWIVTLALFVCVYLLSVTIIGYVQAWVVTKLGDSTPETAGFLTLNPLVHINAFGFILLLLVHLGWGKPVPINPSNIQGRWRFARVLFAFMCGTLLSIVMALLVLVLAVLLYGTAPTISLLAKIFSSDNVLLRSSTMIYSEYSSLSILFGLFLLAFVFFNVFMAVFDLIFNFFRFAFAWGVEKDYKYIEYSEYITILAPMLIIFFFADRLRYCLLLFIIWAACKIALIFGGV